MLIQRGDGWGGFLGWPEGETNSAHTFVNNCVRISPYSFISMFSSLFSSLISCVISSLISMRTFSVTWALLWWLYGGSKNWCTQINFLAPRTRPTCSRQPMETTNIPRDPFGVKLPCVLYSTKSSYNQKFEVKLTKYGHCFLICVLLLWSLTCSLHVSW